MKKFAFLLVAGLFLVAGCGSKAKNQVVCTGEVEESGQKYTMEIKGTLDSNDVITGITAKMTFDSEDMAQSICGIFGLANSMAEDDSEKIVYECDKKSIEIKNYENLAELDGEELEKLSKADFIEEMKNEGLTCK